MPKRYLALRDVAERLGIAKSTVASYQAKGLMPEFDVLIGLDDRPVGGWLPETIDTWNEGRPRRRNK